MVFLVFGMFFVQGHASASFLFESTAGYGGSACDDPIFSNVSPAPNTEISSLAQVSFFVPLKTPNETIRVEVNETFVSNLSFQEISGKKLVTAILPSRIVATGTIRISLFASLSEECPKSFVYDISIVVPPPPLQPTCTLNAFPKEVFAGEKATLEWHAENADWAVLEGESVSPAGGERYIFPQQTTLYKMSVGKAKETSTCEVRVTVHPLPLPSCTLTASPNKVRFGKSTTLSWETHYADSAWFLRKPVSVPTGSKVVFPFWTNFYILAVFNSRGMGMCTEFVRVGW